MENLYDTMGYWLRSCSLLLKYFDYNTEKVLLWMNTENPLLGNAIPYDMILLGRGAKLVKFIENQLDGINP